MRHRREADLTVLLCITKRFSNGRRRDKGRVRITKKGVLSVSLVGKNIDAFCSRCQLTLAHIVLYEVGGVVRAVKCKTCGAEHRYHGPAPEKRRSVPAVRRSGAAPAVRPRTVRPADARQWEARNASTDTGCRRLGLQTDGTLREGRRDHPSELRPRLRRIDHGGRDGGPLPGGPETDGDEPSGNRSGLMFHIPFDSPLPYPKGHETSILSPRGKGRADFFRERGV